MILTGGQALVQQLVKEGITDVFGIPGVQLDWAVDALRQARDKINWIVPRHEQATSYMADGYARSTDRVGACMVVPGPGLLNAMAGLSTAYACNARVLAIIGNIHSQGIGRGYGLLHEVSDQSTLLGAVTKWHGVAKTPQDIPGVVHEAMRRLDAGRPRPVGIEIAHDVLQAKGEVALADVVSKEDGRIRPDPKSVTQAASLLAGARFPVIFVGGGILAAGASLALRQLAEALQAPVVMSDNGRGSLSDRHPLAFNTLGGRALMPHADVVLVAGSRFFDSMETRTAWPMDGKRWIFLNADVSDWSEPRQATVALHSDARLGLEALASEISVRKPPRTADFDKVRDWVRQQADAIEPQTAYTRALRDTIPENGILVTDLTQVGYHARMMYPVWEPNTLLTPGYQGTLGYGFAAGLGAAYGNPERAVVTIIGDGGFGWNLQELATARKYDLGLVTVVFNDGYFGNVRTLQKTKFGEAFGVDLQNPKFDKLAEAYDIPFARVESPDGLHNALKHALAAGGPALIEARVGEMPNPWHLVRLQMMPGLVYQAPPNPLGEPRA